MFARVILELIALIILPVSLFRTGALKPKYRFDIILAVFFVSILLLVAHNSDLEVIGLTDDNLAEALEFYALVTLVGSTLIYLLAKAYRTHFERDWYRDTHKIAFFIPLSLMQQFIFQGFVLHELLSVASPETAVIITAVLFGYMHTIYPHPGRNLGITTAAGLCFATSYLIMPNLIAITLCHAVLNFIVINFGFFTYPEHHPHWS